MKIKIYKLGRYPVVIVAIMLTLSYYTTNNAALSKDPSTVINPFIASKDLCGDEEDNDGNGFVDDNCGTTSLKISHNMSGAISNISSLCHEDCRPDNEENK
jgi:hypothetical protein